MKKTNIFGLAMLTIIALSAMIVASASATTLVWLKNGEEITTPEATKTTGSIELGNEKAIAGFKLKVLCTISLDGTVGPGAEDMITEVLDSAEKRVGLGVNELACTNDSSCPSGLVSPVNLPWLTGLELVGTETEPLFLDLITNGGKGEPGWETMCEEPLIGLVEETCTGVSGKHPSADLENDPSENDVLGTLALEEIFLCTGTNEETGFISTESGGGPSLISLTGGGSLAASLTGQFESTTGSYPISLESENLTNATFTLEEGTGEFQCSTSKYSGKLEKISDLLVTVPVFENCNGTIGEETIKGAVANPTGCQFDFEILKKLKPKEWGIKIVITDAPGEKCEQNIAITAKCTMVLSIDGKNAELIAKTRENAAKDTEIDIDLSKIEYEAAGFGCLFVIPKKGAIGFKHTIVLKNVTIK